MDNCPSLAGPTTGPPSPKSPSLTPDPSCKALNQLTPQDRAFHDWYRFILSFPPHLVRHYLAQFQVTPPQTVLDPFAGTGTTLVECKKLGIPCVGTEANPMAYFASQTKLHWSVNSQQLRQHAQQIAEATNSDLALLSLEGLRPTLPPEATKLLLKNAISHRPLHKVLTLLGRIDQRPHPDFYAHERLALAKVAVLASNLRFAPEISVTKRPKADAEVVDLWLATIDAIATDLTTVTPQTAAPSHIHLGDARTLQQLPPQSIDAVITSPPYPNEKDYTRATRLESVLLGFLHNKTELQAIKKTLVRSNSRSIYTQDTDDQEIANYPSVVSVAQEIDRRRQAWGKTSGFSRLYARATKLYFGGMAKHFTNLQPALRPGARLAYVVGDQASYLQVHIKTGQLLAEIAQTLGYELVDIHLFRTRRASKTEVDLREEVVILRWPG
ncbi:MAG: DNA methyltransferase [Cyanobacteria bacterium P01_F01_bin.4]